MAVPSSLRTANARIDRWFREHVVIWWTVLAAIPASAYAGTQVFLDGEPPGHAVVLGSVFGVVFATVTVVAQRWRRS
jgi:hypothetical protein